MCSTDQPAPRRTAAFAPLIVQLMALALLSAPAAAAQDELPFGQALRPSSAAIQVHLDDHFQSWLKPATRVPEARPSEPSDQGASRIPSMWMAAPSSDESYRQVVQELPVPLPRRRAPDRAGQDEFGLGIESPLPTDENRSPPVTSGAALLGRLEAEAGLDERRLSRVMSPGADVVSGIEAKSRITSDAGNLLGKSLSARGVNTQQRTPIVTDSRVRSQGVGRLLASGSYWAPVRMDLDTMMNKIDSRLIESMLIIKGPYSPRYGPGFSFVDFQLRPSPRSDGGWLSGGGSSLDYQTNGDQWYARQTLWAGNERFGVRFSYGDRAGSDYRAGNGLRLPSSYNSRDFNVAIGFDPSLDERWEFNYLRLDQTDVEFPGLVYDLRYLVTDAYELKYANHAPAVGDHLDAEVWYNRTRFEGDTFGAGKNRQIPELREILFSPSGRDGVAITNGDGLSLGYRLESIFGEVGVDHWAVGTDLIVLRQGLNDIEVLLPADNNNFPLPPSQSVDVGVYSERVTELGTGVSMNTGARADFVNTTSENIVPGVPFEMSFLKEAELDQSFTLWSLYSTFNVDLGSTWTGSLGVGYGQRPPTLTELYVDNAFIGSLQRGLTFLDGDPLLESEKARQIDIGLQVNEPRWQAGVNGFYAWIEDYITYDLSETFFGGGLSSGATFVNTDMATLSGIEGFGRWQLDDRWAVFGTLSYLRGEDRTRNRGSRLLGDPRSGVEGVYREPLPGIPPLESRVGLLWQDPSPRAVWGLELSTRMVARQDRVAVTLEEIETPGFATVDVRGYRRWGEGWLVTFGVENLFDRFYREHLDYRSGLGVFQPGLNAYTGVELRY